MKIYGIWYARDEGDIIREAMEFHRKAKVFDKIFFFDNMSQDNTWDIAMEYRDILHEPQKLPVYPSGRAKIDLIRKHSDWYRDGDWVAFIDTDEFYAEDPRRLIEQAESEGAGALEDYQASFYLSDVEVANLASEDPTAPIQSRRKYYVVNWSETRFYKYFSGSRGKDGGIELDGAVCSRPLPVLHYPYRTPDQIQTRINSRMHARKTKGNSYYHLFSPRWQDYVVDHRNLHEWDGHVKLGIPEGLDWKMYYNFWDNSESGWKSPAYNNTHIFWLMSHGFIRPWTIPEQCLRVLGKTVQKLRGRTRVTVYGGQPLPSELAVKSVPVDDKPGTTENLTQIDQR